MENQTRIVLLTAEEIDFLVSLTDYALDHPTALGLDDFCTGTAALICNARNSLTDALDSRPAGE